MSTKLAGGLSGAIGSRYASTKDELVFVEYGGSVSVIKGVKTNPTPVYSKIGTGYTNLEDIAVASDGVTAYVTERGGSLLKISLTSANRTAPTTHVVCSTLNTPQQLWLDEVHNNAYVVEYASGGRLLKVALATGAITVMASGLDYAVGLVVSSALDYAYVSEQGSSNAISQVSLLGGSKVHLATGFTAPFFLTWADPAESRILVPERDPANRITAVDVVTGNKNVFISGTPTRPSSTAMVSTSMYTVCCDGEVDLYNLPVSTDLYEGIGYVPWNLINSVGAQEGMADTTSQPSYPYQFPKDSPFGGTLPVRMNHQQAWAAGYRYYKVRIDSTYRGDSWNDLQFDTVTGQFDIPVHFGLNADGYYSVHNPAVIYYNAETGCMLDSTSLTNGLHSITVEFYTAEGTVPVEKGNPLYIDNNQCVASISMPTLNGNQATPTCGYLQYTAPADLSHNVDMQFSAYHPKAFANYSFSIIKGAYGHYSESGPLVPNPKIVNHTETVSNLLGTCLAQKVAAFAESLYVATTVINGISRQSQYDASAAVAFCLAP